MEQFLFDKNTEFDTNKLFLDNYPMFKNCKRSIPPFTLPNTVNGACDIFSTPDHSQFIYRMTTNNIVLLGPSKEFIDNIDNVSWLLKNILNSSGSVLKTDTKCIFNYDNKKYYYNISKKDNIINMEISQNG